LQHKLSISYHTSLERKKRELSGFLLQCRLIIHSLGLIFMGLPKITIRSVGEGLSSTWKKLIILIFYVSWERNKQTNKFVELLAMKLLLLFAKEKGINTLQIFGDSMLAINWERNSQQCHDIQMLAILEEIFRLLDSFDYISLQHVYRVHNREADALTKDGLGLDYGKWLITEYLDEDHFSYYDRPFNEIPPPLAALP
jgi:hypothetical protein